MALAWSGSAPTLAMMRGERVAAADLHHFQLAAVEEIVGDLVRVVVLLAGALVDHGEVRRERRGAKAVVRRCMRPAEDRAGHVAGAFGLGIGEVLGGLCHEIVDLVVLELDPIILGERAVRKIGDVDADRLRRVCVARVARIAADRRSVGVELEGIEGGKGIGVVRLRGGKSGYDAKVGLDGDVFAGALMLDHRLMDHVAGGEAGGAELDAVALLHRRRLSVAGECCGPHRLHGGEARLLDRAHHALAVRHVHRGVDGKADEADADHAGETSGGEPFQPMARFLLASFAEIDRQQVALWLGGFG